MKYCIFGFNTYKPTVAKAKNNLATDPFNYDKCVKEYNDIVESKTYKHIYFLVDFGIPGGVPFFSKPINIAMFGYDVIPWVLISYSYTLEYKDGIIPVASNIMLNNIRLKMKGFTEKFNSDHVIEAFERYNYYITNRYKCELYADIFDKNNVFISNTEIDICKNRLDKIYCKKYRI